jgi:hypothetical protein
MHFSITLLFLDVKKATISLRGSWLTNSMTIKEYSRSQEADTHDTRRFDCKATLNG